MDKGIKLEELQVGYGAPVLNKVDFTVNPGEIVCLIGANGAGKSTILKTIIRSIKKLSGKVYIQGEEEAKLDEAELAKKLSMVMTERINPELMTCFDVVATGRYPYTGTLGILSQDDIKAVQTAIEMVGATEVATKDFLKVSDGQRQRVMLARAISQDTDIMILDEPTSFLDIQYKIDILSVIKRLAKEKKKAVIMSIHELEFVPAIADKVIGVSEQKVYKVGTPEEILTGENLEAMYHMASGTGKVMADGLWQYAAALEKLLWQK